MTLRSLTGIVCVDQAVYIPGWSFGPQKKIDKMKEQAEEEQLYFHSTESCEGGKGAERPSPSPPFDSVDPSTKKSPLDEVYFSMEKRADSSGKPGKVKSKKERSYGEHDPNLEKWAGWATSMNWPDTGGIADSDCSNWPVGWGEQVRPPPPP